MPVKPVKSSVLNRWQARLGWPKLTIWLSITVLGLFWLTVLLLFPFGELMSHFIRSGFSMSLYTGAFREMLEPVEASAAYSFIAAGLSVALALPISVVIAGSTQRKRVIFAMATLAPLFVNILLRIYAVRYLVLNGGNINTLYSTYISTAPIFASKGLVLTGLLYLYLPFAVIPMTVSLGNVDNAAIDAAVAVGLRGWRLPYAVARVAILRGIFIGWMLTFVPAFGDYLAPAVLGGDKTRMVANYLYDKAVLGSDAPAAAVGVFLLWVSTAAVMLVWWRLEKRRWRNKRNEE